MTRQVGGPISTDPLDCLVEIVELVAERMDDTVDPPDARESFTLGRIAGTAARYSGVMQQAAEREAERKALPPRVRTI